MTPSVFKQRMNSILRDNAIERFVSNKKKGTLNTKRIYKISNSEKIFKQKEERKGKDYSITLILDASGSMMGSESTVIESTNSLLQQFEKMNIPTSVYSFGKVVRKIKSFNDKPNEKQLGKLYWDTRRLKFWRCNKCFNFDFVIEKVGGINQCPNCKERVNYKSDNSGGTADALALHIVCNEVCHVYTKNIVVVLTDGDGDDIRGDSSKIGNLVLEDLKNTKTVLNKMYKKYSDLIVIAVDIHSGHCEKVYGKQNSYYIREASEIFEAVSKLLARKIKRA